MMPEPRAVPPFPGWNGLMCAICAYAVLSGDTQEGVVELMWLHMTQAHPGVSWQDAAGRKYRNGE